MVIALLTDFGTKDYFVGAMKGAILSINPQAKIVDITHDIAAQNIAAASFTLRACYQDFPKKTIFVAVIDPGVGSKRRAILVETEDYFFIAPDNGLLSFVFDDGSPRVSKGGTYNGIAGENSLDEQFDYSALADARASVFELTNEKFFAKNVSRTFHGRDIFAPVAAYLSNGVSPNEFGASIGDSIRLESAATRRISATEIEAEIIHADNFGNLITNLKAADLPASFILEIGDKTISKLQTYFAAAEKGALLMIVGSAGFLEIAAFQASAKQVLNAAVGDKISLRSR